MPLIPATPARYRRPLSRPRPARPHEGPSPTKVDPERRQRWARQPTPKIFPPSVQLLRGKQETAGYHRVLCRPERVHGPCLYDRARDDIALFCMGTLSRRGGCERCHRARWIASPTDARGVAVFDSGNDGDEGEFETDAFRKQEREPQSRGDASGRDGGSREDERRGRGHAADARTVIDADARE